MSFGNSFLVLGIVMLVVSACTFVPSLTINLLTVMDNVSTSLQLAFIITTVLTVVQFYRATQRSITFLVIIGIWATLQMALASSGFFAVPDATFRFPLLAMPPLVMTVVLFNTRRSLEFIDSLDLRQLTLLHTVRIPVEIVLYYLFVAKAIPELMTFEGRNFDILAGLTAPVAFYFYFVRRNWSNKALLFWNIACLALLANIVVNALLAAPTSFQRFAFDQPNIAIAYFPFNWLPSVVVALVLFSHLVAIRRLFKG